MTLGHAEEEAVARLDSYFGPCCLALRQSSVLRTDEEAWPRDSFEGRAPHLEQLPGIANILEEHEDEDEEVDNHDAMH